MLVKLAIPLLRMARTFRKAGLSPNFSKDKGFDHRRPPAQSKNPYAAVMIKSHRLLQNFRTTRYYTIFPKEVKVVFCSITRSFENADLFKERVVTNILADRTKIH